MNLIVTPINDIVIVDTSGEILNYACEVLSDVPLKCNVSILRKHIANELTRKIYSGDETLSVNDLSECIQRRLRVPYKIEVIGLTKQ